MAVRKRRKYLIPENTQTFYQMLRNAADNGDESVIVRNLDKMQSVMDGWQSGKLGQIMSSSLTKISTSSVGLNAASFLGSIEASKMADASELFLAALQGKVDLMQNYINGDYNQYEDEIANLRGDIDGEYDTWSDAG
jgi:hypothetical protein